MHKQQFVITARRSVGVVHLVDTVNRELTVLVGGHLLTFDVPVDCQIMLHGERVRFRLLQPLDPVSIAHIGHGQRRVASAIEVRSDRAACYCELRS